jgi:NADPH:quinone reductase-like Zn-dependent oxidoreductase
MSQQQSNTMKAVAIDRFGGIEEMKLRSLSCPEIGPDEILVRVESAGVGVWDPLEREGAFAEMMSERPKFPYVLGSDGAGTVVDVGEKVTKFKKGDRVYAFSIFSPQSGFYAEYIAVKESDASPLPSNLSMETAGAMPVDAMTALRGLDDALAVKPGEKIMIFGASGGIGHLALQLAKRMGAQVLAVASGEDGVALAKRLGADAVVDGHKDDVVAAAKQFAPDGLDAALLTAGGEAAEKAVSTLREGGRLAYPHGVQPEPKVRPDIKLKQYDGFPDPEAIAKLNELIKSGPFEVHVAHSFPLEEAAEAHKALKSHHLGKLALKVG